MGFKIVRSLDGVQVERIRGLCSKKSSVRDDVEDKPVKQTDKKKIEEHGDQEANL